MTLPVAADGALVGVFAGALVAALGYVGKLVVETVRDWRHAKAARLARLHQLRALLHASRVGFFVQRDQAARLERKLRARYPDDGPDQPGYERLFTYFHDRLDADEAELHDVIRAYTEHALRPLNQALLNWVRNDVDYRTTQGKTGPKAELADHLNQLDAHLLLWLAKYEAWIPDRPDHALVYVADEEEHGLGFPIGIEGVLDSVIAREK